MQEAVGRRCPPLLGRRALRPRVHACPGVRCGGSPDREAHRPRAPDRGAIAYWCEGEKNKPHRRSDRVNFINSDPALIRFFLRFLSAAGTPHTDLRFRIYIHENADVESAHRFWLQVTGATIDQFATPTLKRHNPKTVRKNVATAIAAVCASTFGTVQSSTARSKAGPRRAWWISLRNPRASESAPNTRGR